MKKALIFSFLLCKAYFGAAQAVIPRFESMGVNEGLPHSSVYSITQDRKGFMWFGTADGLCRYDGTVLKIFKYTAKQADDAVNNFVRGEITEDRNGNIWYCNETGIYKWDYIKEAVIRVKPFDREIFGAAGFGTVYLDEDNALWIFSAVHGILEYNISTGSLKQYPLPPHAAYANFSLIFICNDTQGNIWFRVGDKTDPYCFFNRRSHTYSVQLKTEPPNAIFFYESGRVLAYEDRLLYEDAHSPGKEITVLKTIDGQKISFYSTDGIRDKYGRLWLTATGNGLFCYDEKNKFFKAYRHDNNKIKSLPMDITTCLYIDHNENLWIGTDGAGVARLDLKEPRFNIFPLSEGDFPILHDYFIKCFYEDKKGRIWFGTQTDGFNIFDTHRQTLINFQHDNKSANSLPGNMVGSILEDANGQVVIGSSGGFSVFNEQQHSFKHIPVTGLPKLYPLINNLVYKMIRLHNGDILSATSLGMIRIVKERPGEYRGYYFADRKFNNSLCTDITELPDKTIYATCPGLGLYHLIPDGTSFKLLDRFFTGIDLRSVRKDEKDPDVLWIGSGRGLIRFNTVSHEYKIWDENAGLQNNYVYGSLEDSAGNVWLSSNKGLSFFDRQHNKFEHYNFRDGLQSNEFNTQAFYKSPSGVFYFGGIKGFNWFKPGESSRNNKEDKPVAAITGIEINGSVFQKDPRYILNHTISLPYDSNDLNFQFAALDYTRPEANNIIYMLEGWDERPIMADARSARYSNLPPGHYTLKLRVSNAAGILSNEETLRITVHAPFWKRAWFIAAIAALLLLIIIWMTWQFSQRKAKHTLRSLEKQIAIDLERNRISADMHDEIGSGITHIALVSELMQTKDKTGSEMEKDIKMIAGSARKLVQTISEIIWALNPQNDTLESLLAYTREQSKEYFEGMPVTFKINFPEIVPHIKLSNEQRRNIYLVTREALNNAMKHSGADTIELNLEITKTFCCFTVTDNGAGMKRKDRQEGGNGLLNMKKRMKDIGGTVEWFDTQKGTTVKYCLTL